jgi:hypothetical protein
MAGAAVAVTVSGDSTLPLPREHPPTKLSATTDEIHAKLDTVRRSEERVRAPASVERSAEGMRGFPINAHPLEDPSEHRSGTMFDIDGALSTSGSIGSDFVTPWLTN